MTLLGKIGLDIGMKLAIIGIKQWATNKYGDNVAEVTETVVDCVAEKVDKQTVLSVLKEFSNPYGNEATLEEIAGYYLSNLKPEKIGMYIECCYQGQSPYDEADEFAQQLWIATADIRNVVADEDIRENAKFEEMCKNGLKEAFLRITASPRFIADTTRRIEKHLTLINDLILPPEQKKYPHFLTDEESTDRCWHRESELLDLQNLIKKGNRLILINGFGGIGKSTIAKEIFRRIHAEFSYAGFVTFSESWIDCINSHFHSSLFPWEEYEEKPEVRFNAICNFLQDEPGTKLLVIDNYNYICGDDAILKKLSKKTDVTLILTSRLSKIEKFVPFSIDRLSEEASMNLFYRYFENGGGVIQTSEQSVVEKLVHSVHRHTLSIELLAKTACECPYNLSSFYGIISQLGIAYDDVEVQTEYAEATMKEHLRKLFDWHSLFAWGDNAGEMLRILRNFSLMPSVNIPAEVAFWINCEHSDLMKLDKAGWISFDRATKTFYMHPVVKEILCLDKEQYANNIGVEFLNCLSDRLFIKLNVESIREVAVKLEIAESFLSQLKGSTSKEYIGACSGLALCLGEYGEYKKEQELSEYALELGKKYLSPGDELLAQLYNNLASIYDSQGRTCDAHCNYMKVLETLAACETGYVNCMDYARVCNNIALFYTRNGNFKLAETLYKEAINIQEKYLGVDHAETAMSYNNLGGLYAEIGDFEKEQQCYLKAFDIRKRVLGESHPDVANSYHNIAGLYVNKGEYIEAEEYYVKAISIRETMLGEMHEDTAVSYYNLATLYKLCDRFSEAEELYKKTISIREIVLGEMHPETAKTFTGISLLYKKQGYFDKAEEFSKKAIEILESSCNRKTLAIADAYSALASVCAAQGDYHRAEKLFQQALEIQIGFLGELHSTTANTYDNLAGVYAMTDKVIEAEELYNKAKAINESVWGKLHLKTAITYNNLACFYQTQQRYNEAELYCLKAVDTRRTQLGDFHTDTATSLHNMGTIRFGQKRYDEAVELFSFSLFVYSSKMGNEHVNTIASLQWLKMCFDCKFHPQVNSFEEWIDEEYRKQYDKWRNSGC